MKYAPSSVFLQSKKRRGMEKPVVITKNVGYEPEEKKKYDEVTLLYVFSPMIEVEAYLIWLINNNNFINGKDAALLMGGFVRDANVELFWVAVTLLSILKPISFLLLIQNLKAATISTVGFKE